MSKAKRAALYLRVSTGDQTTENQRTDLEKLADLRGWSVVKVYEDAGISGTKGREGRPGLDALLKDARKRRFDVAVFWSVDRLGRSTAKVAGYMDDLEACNVHQFYFKESMDTATAHGRAMLEMAAVFARLEHSMIRERVNAGLARARAKGIKLGRPGLTPAAIEKLRAAREAGDSVRKIADRFKVSVGVAHKFTADVAMPAEGRAA